MSLSSLVSLPTGLWIKAALFCLRNWGWGGGKGRGGQRGKTSPFITKIPLLQPSYYSVVK